MSQVIDLCEDSDDNEERPNAASLPSLPLSFKRPRDKEKSSNDTFLRNNGPVNKTAKGSAEFVVDLELANDAEISHHKKRRVVVRRISSAKNDAAGNCALMLKGVEATEQDFDGEDSELTSRNDGSASNASGQQWTPSVWRDRLSELADYRKIHGHCNVPGKYSENSKLGTWVANQRKYYMLHLKGKTSPMTTFRIQELESLGFEWRRIYFPVWEDRLTELADYRKIYGHCNVPSRYSKNTKLGVWVAAQRNQYMLHLKGETSFITLPRIQALESLGFEWKLSIGRGERTRKKPSLDDDARRVHKKLANARQGADSQLETAPFNAILRTTGYH
jgi:hypothetical protein